MIGKKCWVIPDCELPDAAEGKLISHESVVVVNTSKKHAHLKVTLYFSDKPAIEGIVWNVPACSVQCFRTNNTEHMNGHKIEYNMQYAMKIESDMRVIVQYGRLDNRQVNLAYYTTLGYSE